LKSLPPDIQQLQYRRLPSTSPANAGYSFARRLEAWGELASCPRGDAQCSST